MVLLLVDSIFGFPRFSFSLGEKGLLWIRSAVRMSSLSLVGITIEDAASGFVIYGEFASLFP